MASVQGDLNTGVPQYCSEMGNAAGVPIEPPEQTAILDATLAIPGVLVAGVPGGTPRFELIYSAKSCVNLWCADAFAAGGYDAICVVVLHESALHAVEDLWVQWSSSHPSSM
ncbi:unnamed protein product [Phytophthora fragariaefolia]|uniref:Unnamed protein product n=1 Tax=Phytophthora fragariaefolia TaxID=1490495 RepID=A0A9W6WQ66_9STRA|nr:unnamed protein product [Phytophthora fragariaefolia]